MYHSKNKFYHYKKDIFSLRTPKRGFVPARIVSTIQHEVYTRMALKLNQLSIHYISLQERNKYVAQNINKMDILRFTKFTFKKAYYDLDEEGSSTLQQ